MGIKLIVYSETKPHALLLAIEPEIPFSFTSLTYYSIFPVTKLFYLFCKNDIKKYVEKVVYNR